MTPTHPIPNAWKQTEKGRAEAVLILVEETSSGYKLRPYLEEHWGDPKLRSRDLLEDLQHWSSAERRVAELAVHLWNSSALQRVDLAKTIGGQDRESWPAVRKAIDRYAATVRRDTTVPGDP